MAHLRRDTKLGNDPNKELNCIGAYEEKTLEGAIEQKVSKFYGYLQKIVDVYV